MSRSLIEATGEIEEISFTKLSKANTVTKSNTFIEARYSLPLIQGRLANAIFSTVKMEDTAFYTVTFNVKELAEFCNIGASNYYGEIKDASHDLMQNVLTYKIGDKVYQTHFLSSAIYHEKLGIVTYKIDNTLAPFLLQLKEKFTSLPVAELMSFRKSAYSSRIYELLMQYRDIGKRRIELDELKYYLKIESKAYELFSNVKKRIIEPALLEINEITPYQVTCEYQKTGRKYTAFLFVFSEKDDYIPTNKKNKVLNVNEVYHALSEVGLEDEYEFFVKQRRFNPNRIIENIKYTVDQSKKTLIANVPAYAKKAILDDYAQIDTINLFEAQKQEQKAQQREEYEKVVKKLEEQIEKENLDYEIQDPFFKNKISSIKG